MYQCCKRALLIKFAESREYCRNINRCPFRVAPSSTFISWISHLIYSDNFLKANFIRGKLSCCKMEIRKGFYAENLNFYTSRTRKYDFHISDAI